MNFYAQYLLLFAVVITLIVAACMAVYIIVCVIKGFGDYVGYMIDRRRK